MLSRFIIKEIPWTFRLNRMFSVQILLETINILTTACMGEEMGGIQIFQGML